MTVLQKDKTESASFDLYFRVNQGVSFSVSGQSEVHLCGYWEPTEDLLGEGEGFGGMEEDSEDEEISEEELAALRKAKANTIKNQTIPDDEDSEEEDSDEELKQAAKKVQKGKKQAVEVEDSDDDDDDEVP